MQQDNDEWEM